MCLVIINGAQLIFSLSKFMVVLMTAEVGLVQKPNNNNNDNNKKP